MTARAVLSTPLLHVEPGSEVTAVLTIRNTGAVVDHFHVQVLGDAARWATVTPETLPLFPDAEGQVAIAFRPARVAAAHAGATPFGVKVTSEVDPGDSSVEEGTLDIGAFTELTGELIPAISSGSRSGRHQLACDNRGNIPLTLAFGAVDPEEALRFQFDPPSVVAASGTATIVTLRARPKKRFLTGSPKTHRFQTVIQPKEAAPVNVDGSMVQLPMLPKWLPKALAALVALVVVAAVLWFTLLDPAIKSTATQATNQALSAAGISPGGGGGGGGGGSPSPSTPSGTTVTPTPASSQGGPASGRLAVKVNAGGNSGCPGGNCRAVHDPRRPGLLAHRPRLPEPERRHRNLDPQPSVRRRPVPGAAQQLPRPRLPFRQRDHVRRGAEHDPAGRLRRTRSAGAVAARDRLLGRHGVCGVPQAGELIAAVKPGGGPPAERRVAGHRSRRRSAPARRAGARRGSRSAPVPGCRPASPR